MQRPYALDGLVPQQASMDEDGDLHSVYVLPAPKLWEFRVWSGGKPDDVTTITRVVRKVRICIYLDKPAHRVATLVVPFNELGEEDHRGSVVFAGVYSIVGVLDRIGFAPMLPDN